MKKMCKFEAMQFWNFSPISDGKRLQETKKVFKLFCCKKKKWSLVFIFKITSNFLNKSTSSRLESGWILNNPLSPMFAQLPSVVSIGFQSKVLRLVSLSLLISHLSSFYCGGNEGSFTLVTFIDSREWVLPKKRLKWGPECIRSLSLITLGSLF